MPIYEYRCQECGFQDEYLQKVSEPPMTVCPSCGKASFRKLLSAAGFQLKGSGWYATDFKGSGKPAKSEDKAGDKPDAKGESTGEQKSEAKADASKSEAAPASPAAASGN